MNDIKNFTLKQLSEKFLNIGLKKFKAKQVFKWIYNKGIFDFNKMTDISKKDRKLLKKVFKLSVPNICSVNKSVDGTIKFAIKLYDDEIIESVLIPDNNRLTLCISTQVGCRMGCKFCYTAMMRFRRNLEPFEIIDQIIAGKFLIDNQFRKITNIVFMGMGEPLDNYENISSALKIIMEPFGFQFSYRKITVSTCGLVDKMVQFGNAFDINLAVSLHAADDNKRSQLMPINNKYSLAKLIKACKDYPLKNRQRITFEYLMIKGFNDSLYDAKNLVRILSQFRSKVNLIQFNTFPSNIFRPSDIDTIKKFQEFIMKKGITATLRKSKGADILAACGQLTGRLEKSNNI